jgi:hypothetical protein
MKIPRIGVLVLCIALQASAFSIPGLVPTNYKRGDRLPILAGKLMSSSTELPFDFYDLNWCNNTVGGGYDLKPVAKNLRGVNLVHSPMDVSADDSMTFVVYIWLGQRSWVLLEDIDRRTGRAIQIHGSAWLHIQVFYRRSTKRNCISKSWQSHLG